MYASGNGVIQQCMGQPAIDSLWQKLTIFGKLLNGTSVVVVRQSWSIWKTIRRKKKSGRQDSEIIGRANMYVSLTIAVNGAQLRWEPFIPFIDFKIILFPSEKL